MRLLTHHDFQSVIKEEFSYYSPSGPKYEKFSKHLTVREMVRLHFDPYVSSFDLSKQPILVLDKVDKFWPAAPKPNIKTEDIKEEPLEVEDEDNDLDWEREAEAEILAANEGFFDPPSSQPSPPGRQEKIKLKNIGAKNRPKRARTKPKTYREEFEDSDPDDVESKDDDDMESLFGDYPEGGMVKDPDFDGDDPGSDFSMDMDMLGEESDEDLLEDDNSNLDMTLVKEEIEDMEDEHGMEGHRAGGLLASSKECKVVEIGGLKVETYGDYSKCPKCEKNIKSTFIIRHIKLHDQPSTTMNCPYKDCSTSFTRLG